MSEIDLVIANFWAAGGQRVASGTTERNLSNNRSAKISLVFGLKSESPIAIVFLICSAGRIRTYNQLVNSELRYRCATGEYTGEYSRFRARAKDVAQCFRLNPVSLTSCSATMKRLSLHPSGVFSLNFDELE